MKISSFSNNKYSSIQIVDITLTVLFSKENQILCAKFENNKCLSKFRWLRYTWNKKGYYIYTIAMLCFFYQTLTLAFTINLQNFNWNQMKYVRSLCITWLLIVIKLLKARQGCNLLNMTTGNVPHCWVNSKISLKNYSKIILKTSEALDKYHDNLY